MYLGMSPASRAATMPTTVPIRVPGRSPAPLTRAQAHADAGRKTASGCHQQAVVHAGGIPQRVDDDSGRNGDLYRSPCPCSFHICEVVSTRS